jgi:hypothetical protein
MINTEVYKITEHIESYFQARIQATLQDESLSIEVLTQRSDDKLPADFVALQFSQGPAMRESVALVTDDGKLYALPSIYPGTLTVLVATARNGENAVNHAAIKAIVCGIIDTITVDQASEGLGLEHHVILEATLSSNQPTVDKDKVRDRDVSPLQYDFAVGVKNTSWIAT